MLKAVSSIHKLNINVASELDKVVVINSFPEVTVFDLLLFLCKEYHLTMEFTGSIIALKPYVEPPKMIEERVIPVTYDAGNNVITIDAKSDSVDALFRRIIDVSGKNLVYAPGLESMPVTAYIVKAPFEVAMYKLALANNLFTEKTKDGFWIFQNHPTTNNANGSNGTFINRGVGDAFKILSHNEKLLEVDFDQKPIANVIKEISQALDLNIFTATPLEKAGQVTLKSKAITFDELLMRMFEANKTSATPPTNGTTTRSNSNATVTNNSGENFNFKKEGNTYFFGTEDQLSIRSVEVIHLKYRSVELLSDPSSMNGRNSISNNVLNNLNSFNNGYGNVGVGGSRNNNYNNRGNQNTNYERTEVRRESSESILSIFPEEITKDLEINVDYELSSFYVSGAASAVERFKKFVEKIDKPVPMILIEVMIIEAKKSANLETGVSWGIGDEPATTKGAIYPETDMTLGANTVNKLIGSFNSFAGFNLGKVGPNFFATIKAMESNGDLKIKSTPKLATINSHRATFSNGQTSFYAVTERNIYGTDNPQTSEITNYLPIDAELGLTIKPSVSGNGQVLLDISVIQSSFGTRIAEDAPPDIVSRSFSSIIRMQDQDVAILGGLEEQVKNDSGSGVPFLARIPIIKYLFSKRKRTASKSKLTILIKPTVIR